MFLQALLLSVVAIRTLPLFRSLRMSAFAAPSHPSGSRPLRKYAKLGPFRFLRTRKPSVPGRVQSIVSGLMVVNQPLAGSRHGSKDVDNLVCLGGAAANQVSWFSQPLGGLTAPASSYVNIFSCTNSTWSRMMWYAALASLCASAVWATMKLVFLNLRL